MIEILYQDEHLVAVNKPSGWLVHRSWLDRHETRFMMQTVRDQLGQHVFTVHRLDRPTSGVLLMALAVLYRFGPSKNDPNWQWISPGALLAAVGLILGSLLFSWYAANFGNYNETYGSLSAAIVLMVWLWLSAVVVLVGAELNSEVERQIKIENGVQPQDEKNLQKQIDSHEAAKR